MASKKKSTSKRKPKAKHRSSWRGMLRFGLVTFPVQAFNAINKDRGSIAMHQLHAECHSRIHYEKVCPIHGPVDQSEIISGYEYAKGKYVEFDEEELDDVAEDKQRSLTIDTFIGADELDPVYMDGRMYYLAPDGKEAAEPYAVFLAALNAKGRVGIGEIFFSGKDQLVMIRPYERILQMAMLNYAVELRDPHEFVSDLPRLTRGDKKLRLAEQLINSWSEDGFDFSSYEDTHRERLQELIDAKVEGREIVAPEVEEQPEVINLMDALRKSLKKTGAKGRADGDEATEDDAEEDAADSEESRATKTRKKSTKGRSKRRAS